MVSDAERNICRKKKARAAERGTLKRHFYIYRIFSLLSENRKKVRIVLA